jgi:hypothetical protein
MAIFSTTKSIGQLFDGDAYQYLTSNRPNYERFVFASETGDGDWEEPATNGLKFTILPDGLVYMAGDIQTKEVSTGGLPIVGTIPQKFRPKATMTFGLTTLAAGNALTLFFNISPDTGNMFVFPNATLPPSAKFSLEGKVYIPQSEE